MSAADPAPELLKELRWTSFWNDIKARIYQEVNQARKVRPLLPLSGFDAQPGAIPDYTIAEGRPEGDTERPVTLEIASEQRLVSVQIACEFQLFPHQEEDRNVALQLVTAAANRLGLAEDAVLLHGCSLLLPDPPEDGQEEKNPSKEIGFGRVGIRHDNLGRQDDYLMQEPSSDKRKDPHPPARRGSLSTQESITLLSGAVLTIPEDLLPKDDDPPTILEVILEGIRKLRQDGHHGEYCAVVAPDLYEEAFTPRRVGALAEALQDDHAEAPIFQIRPLLREGGFTYSSMAVPGTGVIFSVGGGAISLAVPEEPRLTFVRKERGNVLNVTERFRLLINDDKAVKKLRRSRLTKEQQWMETKDAIESPAEARLIWDLLSESPQVLAATFQGKITQDVQSRIEARVVQLGLNQERLLQIGEQLYRIVFDQLKPGLERLGLEVPDDDGN